MTKWQQRRGFAVAAEWLLRWNVKSGGETGLTPGRGRLRDFPVIPSQRLRRFSARHAFVGTVRSKIAASPPVLDGKKNKQTKNSGPVQIRLVS